MTLKTTTGNPIQPDFCQTQTVARHVTVTNYASTAKRSPTLPLFGVSLTNILGDADSWHRLDVRKDCYFKTPVGPIPSDPGWYLIYVEAGRSPLYVGQADNLNCRLNSDNGSLDNFAHGGRSSDPARNFIKALWTMGYISNLCAGVVRAPDLLHRLGASGPLEPIDRNNVEKMLGLFRNKAVGVI